MDDIYKGVKTFYPSSRKAWRAWLQKNHEKEDSVWLILYNKGTSKESIDYAQAVEEALCFGWIDSKPNKRDEESRYQFFSKRNPKSNWSALNKERVKRLTEAGLITPAGQAMIDLAKQTGTWDALNDIDTIPPDLMQALKKNKEALKNYEAFPPSARRGIHDWIQQAKRPETREKRINQTVELAAQNIRANQYNPEPPKQ